MASAGWTGCLLLPTSALSASSLTYCWLLVVSSCWRCGSSPSRAAAAVARGAALSWDLTGNVWRNSRRLLLAANKWEDYRSWTCCLHTCVDVSSRKSAHAWVFLNFSDLSTVSSAQPQVCRRRAPSRPLFVFVFLTLLTIHKKQLTSFYILGFLRVFLLLLFSSSPLANLIFLPLSSLPQLSSFSHAPVGEHNAMAMAMLCMVCVWCHTTTTL